MNNPFMFVQGKKNKNNKIEEEKGDDNICISHLCLKNKK